MHYNYLLKWIIKHTDGKSLRLGCSVWINTRKILKNNKL